MAQLMPLPLTVSCFSKIQIGFTFLVPAHPGSPGKRAVKWYVCVCWLPRTFCSSRLMNGKNQQEAQEMQDGSWNGIVGEVGLGRGMGRGDTLGSQANTIWQWLTTTCLPSFISIGLRSSVLPEFTFLSNSGQTQGWVTFGKNLGEKGLTAVNVD